MKDIKHIVCLTAGIITLMAVNVSATAATTSDANTQPSQGAAQTAQSAAALSGIIHGLLGNATGVNKLTPLQVPEPATMALAGLGGASLLLLRRNRK
jgi:hypothetical protein